MRVIALINAYNEVTYLERCVRNISSYVDDIVISCTDWPTGLKSSDDGTYEVAIELTKNHTKVKYYIPGDGLASSNPRINEAELKTRMMNHADPKDGDWIWIVEADEFYLAHQLQGLKGRLLLGHKAITEHNKHWVTISALTFAYNHFWAYYGYHGRFFRYKKGSKFTLSNHFSWPSGEISTDAHRWHIPICHLCQFHMKFVKPLNRIRNRCILNTNPKDDEGYRNWYEKTFKVWPSNPNTAYRNNPPLHGWSKGIGTKLFKYDGEFPKELNNLELDLYQELK